MLGTYRHRGGPPPLRADVTYEYPFELYAAHLGTSDCCLRLPWRQRHAHDDVGAVVHEEQNDFVSSVLSRAAVPHRTSAPGEYVFASGSDAELALLALALALGVNDWI